jgi:hypothetical protein
MRPNLGVHQKEQAGLNPRYHPPYHKTPVERAVEDSIRVPELSLGNLPSGQSRNRDEYGIIWKGLTQQGQQRSGRYHFPHRHRMDPDGQLTLSVELRGQESEPFFERRPVLTRSETPVHKVRKPKQEGRRQEEAV